MGKNVKHLLLFAIRNPGWQTFGKDRATTDALAVLVKDGLVVVNGSGQFRLNLPPWVARQSRDVQDMGESRCTQFTRCTKCGRLHDSGWECVHCKAAEPKPKPEPEPVRPMFARDGQREFGGAG